MSVQAVVFDLGGVLVRTEDQSPRQRLAARLGIPAEELYKLIFDSATARQATVGAITTADHWAAVRQALEIDEAEFSRVIDDFWGGDELDWELVDYIRSLRPGRRTALLSNAWDNLRRVLVEDWQIADAFDELIISAEVGVAKPEARIFQLAIERIRVQPGEAVFVDDMPHNVAAAQALGWHAILFRSPEQARQQLEALVNAHD